MPLVTVTLRKGKSADFKSSVLFAVHRALVASGVPEADRFQRVLELGPDDFRFDPTYPDATSARTDDFVLIGDPVGELGLRRRPDDPRAIAGSHTMRSPSGDSRT